MRLTEPAATALWSRLQAFELDPPGLTRTISARIAEENGWTAEYTRRAIEEYRRFLLLTQVAGRPVSPSVAVDVVWHTHLLYSRDYWGRLCGEVLGVPLHHNPNPGGEQEDALHRDHYRNALREYLQVFGEEAPVDLWPNAWAAPVPTLETMSDRSRMLTRLLAGSYRPSLLAYMSGGDARVTATALAGLHQRQLLGFVDGQPVLGDRVPSDDEGLTPEEWTVWRHLTNPHGPVKLPLALTYPEVRQEALNEGLYPTQEEQARIEAHKITEHRAALWRNSLLWLLVALALYGSEHWIWATLVVLGRLFMLYVTYDSKVVAYYLPTRRGFQLRAEFNYLVPSGTSVSLDSPLLVFVVAAGVIGAATGGDLDALKQAIVPPPPPPSCG